MKRKLLIISTLIILFSSFISICFAQVQTRLRIIKASNVGSGIDPSLMDIHSQLGSLFSFTSYRLMRDDVFTLFGNKPINIPLDRERYIEVTLLGKTRSTAELKVRIRGEKVEILNTQVRLSSGRTIVIGGPKHGDGVALLAISANF